MVAKKTAKNFKGLLFVAPCSISYPFRYRFLHLSKKSLHYLRRISVEKTETNISHSTVSTHVWDVVGSFTIVLL